MTMRQLWRWLVLGLACLIVAANGAVAQLAPQRIALVIGNGAYASISKLPNPPNDAELIAKALKDANFATVTVRSDLGVEAMRRALQTFQRSADGAEVAVVYYAGHGIEVDQKNWLIPVDADPKDVDDLDYDAVDLALVLRAVSGARMRVVMLDSCRDNPFANKWTGATRNMSARGLAAVLNADDVLVLYAAAPGEVAVDGAGKNSPFAISLAKRLPEPGLALQLLGGMVRDDVLEATQQKQRPYVSASITGQPFYLVSAKRAAGALDNSERAELEQLRVRIQQLEAASRTTPIILSTAATAAPQVQAAPLGPEDWSRSALNQARPAPNFRRVDDCTKHPLSLPEGQLKVISDLCLQQFMSARKLPDELANAGYNAGLALVRQGDFAKALPVLEKVANDQRGGAVRIDAKYQLAVAYAGRAGELDAAAPERASLLGQAITVLDELATSAPRGTALYSSAIFLRATLYGRRNAGALDSYNAIDGFALIAEGGVGVDPAMQAEARRGVVEIGLRSGGAEMSTPNDAPAAQRALALYEKAVRFDPRNPDLNVGMGDAALTIARSAAAADAPGWFTRAKGFYGTAAASGGAQAVRANIGMARAARGVQQLPEAIGYYKAALGAGVDRNLRVEMLDAMLDLAASLPAGVDKDTAVREAETFHAALAGDGSLPDAQRTLLQVKLADVQAQTRGTEEARRTLLAAITADAASVSARLQLARLLFDKRELTEAETHFRTVLQLTGGANGAPGPGDVEAKAEANYYLSVIKSETSEPASLAEAVSLADAALQLGGVQPRYSHQACIARLLRGGVSVSAPGAVTVCGGEDPEALLLRGMFYLRLAQISPAAAKTIARDSAYFAFDAGLAAVARSTPPPVAASVYKPAGASTLPPIREMLEYGKAVVIGCSGGSARVSLTGEQVRASQAVFERHRVSSCVAS